MKNRIPGSRGVSVAFALLVLVVVLGAAGMAYASSVVFKRPAGAGLVDAHGLVILTPDFRSAVGLDAKGRKRWKTRLQEDARGTQLLTVLADSPVAVTGDRAHLLNGATGKVRRQLKTGSLGGVGRRGCWLDEAEGGCAIRCQCTFQIIDCEGGNAIGPRFKLPIGEEMTAEGGPWSGCRGDSGNVLARAGELVLAVTPKEVAARGKFFVPNVLRAIDVSNGKTRWTAPAPVISVSFSGVSGDGKTCWLSGYDGVLVALECKTGAERWRATHQVAKDARPSIRQTVDGSALLIRDGEMVRLKRLSDGVALWTLHAPGEAVSLAGDTRPQTTSETSLRTVAVSDGSLVASFQLPARGSATWVATPDGGWIVGRADGLIRFNARGTEVAGAALPDARWPVLGETRLAVHTSKGLALLDVDTLAILDTRTDVSEQILGVEGPLGQGRVALFVNGEGARDPKDPKTFGEVVVLQTSAKKGAK
ncbi:MAG: outer membrane protein assembly factor BamB [Myxococcota bacterium]|jgi:outer membrane protein assembly factor BamB